MPSFWSCRLLYSTSKLYSEPLKSCQERWTKDAAVGDNDCRYQISGTHFDTEQNSLRNDFGFVSLRLQPFDFRRWWPMPIHSKYFPQQPLRLISYYVLLSLSSLQDQRSELTKRRSLWQVQKYGQDQARCASHSDTQVCIITAMSRSSSSPC